MALTPESTSYIRKPEFKLVKGVRDGVIYMMGDENMMKVARITETYPRHGKRRLCAHIRAIIRVKDLMVVSTLRVWTPHVITYRELVLMRVAPEDGRNDMG